MEESLHDKYLSFDDWCNQYRDTRYWREHQFGPTAAGMIKEAKDFIPEARRVFTSKGAVLSRTRLEKSKSGGEWCVFDVLDWPGN